MKSAVIAILVMKGKILTSKDMYPSPAVDKTASTSVKVATSQTYLDCREVDAGRCIAIYLTLFQICGYALSVFNPCVRVLAKPLNLCFVHLAMLMQQIELH